MDRSEVRSMSFSGDGRFLAVVGEDPNVLIVSTWRCCVAGMCCVVLCCVVSLSNY